MSRVFFYSGVTSSVFFQKQQILALRRRNELAKQSDELKNVLFWLFVGITTANKHSFKKFLDPRRDSDQHQHLIDSFMGHAHLSKISPKSLSRWTGWPATGRCALQTSRSLSLSQAASRFIEDNHVDISGPTFFSFKNRICIFWKVAFVGLEEPIILCFSYATVRIVVLCGLINYRFRPIHAVLKLAVTDYNTVMCVAPCLLVSLLLR